VNLVRTIFVVAAATTLTVAVPAGAGEEPVIEDVLAILRDRGIVDDAEHAELLRKQRSYEEKRSPLARFEFSGDLRLRFENFWYSNSVLDEDRPDRSRGRYRLRLNAKAHVNDWVDAIIQVASGETVDLDEGSHRSNNRTFGRGADFALNPLFISRAYVELSAPTRWVGEEGSLRLRAGKVKNPFVWGESRDYILWDHDINPEGVAVLFERRLNEALEVFANAGYFIADENSTASDPHVIGGQIGVLGELGESLRLGGRASFYDWRSLDAAFLRRAANAGNELVGLGSRVATGELAAFALYEGIEDWPLRVYGHLARNFSADATPGFGKQDTGWMLGAEIGDKRRYVRLGGGYLRLEANFWPGQFSDSDILDGITNRKGWVAYGSRELMPNTDLNLTVFVSDPIEDAVGTFENSVNLSDRVRLQADLMVRF
jgi:hypothetical protein